MPEEKFDAFPTAKLKELFNAVLKDTFGACEDFYFYYSVGRMTSLISTKTC